MDINVNNLGNCYNAYKKQFELKTQQLSTPQETANKVNDSKNVVIKSWENFSSDEKKKEISATVRIIKLHFLSRLYAQENQFFQAWYTSHKAFRESKNLTVGEHLSAFVGGLAYLKKLEAADYEIAAKILFL